MYYLHNSTLVYIALIPNFVESSVVPNFFCKFRKTFPKYWWFDICMLRNSIFDLFMCLHTSHLFPDAGWVRSITSFFLFPKSAFWVSSCFLAWEYTAGCWLVSRTCWHSPRCWNRSHLGEKSSSYSRVSATPNSQVSASTSLKSEVSASPSPNLLQKYLLAVSMTWHSVSCLKERNGCKKTLKISWYSINEGVCTHHVRSFLWVTCQQFDSWCQHVWFGSWNPSFFCPTTNQVQLCHCWTSALNGHFDHGFIIFKDVQLRLALGRMCLWWRGPHATIAQHLGFPVAWVWISDFANSVLSHNCLQMLGWLLFWRCLSNATLLSPHPIKGERVIHPFVSSIQRNDFWFCGTVGWWRLFLAHLTNGWQMFGLRWYKRSHTEVDFESWRSPANSESWNKPSRQCWAVLPTWQYCR